MEVLPPPRALLYRDPEDYLRVSAMMWPRTLGKLMGACMLQYSLRL